MEKDYYEILGISRLATKQEIEKAYRSLTVKYHPDRHGNNLLVGLAREKFKEVQEAYSVLIDETKRIQYNSRYQNYPEKVYYAYERTKSTKTMQCPFCETQAATSRGLKKHLMGLQKYGGHEKSEIEAEQIIRRVM